MGFRFRKTIKMGPVNLNISKSGVGTSIGGKGLRVGVNSKGKSYTSASIPGTGLGYTSYGKSKSNSRNITASNMVTNYKKIHSYNPDNLSSQYFELPFQYTQISGQIGCLMLSVWIVAIVLCFSSTPLGLTLVAGLCVYQYFVNKKPENKRNAALKQAQKYFSSGKYKNALLKLLPINTIIPKDFAVSHLLGLCNFNCGNFMEASQNFEDALAANPSDARSMLFLGHIYRSLGTEETLNKSIQFYEKFLEQNPQNNDVKFLIANALFEVQDYESAILYLQKIPESSNNYLKSLNAIATCFVKSNQLDLAIDTLKRAPLLKRNLDDDLKEIHYSLGVIYIEQNDNQQALKHFNRIYSQDVSFKDVSEKVKISGLI